MTTIAIADPQHPTKVSLWCEVRRRRPDGTVDFYVLNGAWNGSLSPSGDIHVDRHPRPGLRGHIVWEGTTPVGDYNEAIAWIEQQLSTPKDPA